MTLPTDYVDGDVLTAADVNAITVAVNSNTNGKLAIGTFNAKGDLLVGLTNDSVGVLTVGTNGYLLSASSGATSGLAWVAAGGKLLGFASDSDSTNRTSTSTTFTDITGLSVTYTPVSASSTLVVDLYVNCSVYLSSSTAGSRKAQVRILKDGGGLEVIGEFGEELPLTDNNILQQFSPVHLRGILSSGSTSAQTFKAQFKVPDANLTVSANNGSSGAYISVMEISA